MLEHELIEVDRISEHYQNLETLSDRRLKLIEASLDNLAKNTPTVDEIYKRLSNDQSILATKSTALLLTPDS